MEKIRTVFKRDPETRRVVDEFVVPQQELAHAIPTLKRDGVNVRVTVRSGESVRLEARRNPNKQQKARGIIEPWYRDAIEGEPADRFMFEALANTDLSELPDGEWPAEALGPKFQGNPMGLEEHRLLFFTLSPERFPGEVPSDFAGLREFLLAQPAEVEGIVWHAPEGGFVGKLKRKDFQSDSRSGARPAR